MINDKIKLKEFIFNQINFENINNILDLGCGNCDDLKLLRSLHPKKRFELYGIDKIENDNFEDINYIKHDINKKLPFKNNTFDLIYSHNLLECIKDKKSHLKELHRLLKNKGKIICSHTDWDSQLIDGDNKELIRKILRSYAEWKQPWMDGIDSWTGRRLRGIFNNSKLFSGEIKSYSIINTSFSEGNYSYNTIKSFEDMVQQKLITKKEYREFSENMALYQSQDKYFYSITSFIYYGKKI